MYNDVKTRIDQTAPEVKRRIEELASDILYELEAGVRREYESNRGMSVEFYQERLKAAKEKAIRDAVQTVDCGNAVEWMSVFNEV